MQAESLRPFAALSMHQGMSMGVKGKIAKRRRFEAHVLVHLDDLYRAAGKPSDAEDLVQETSCEPQALDQFRQTGAAKAWVFAILRLVFLRQAERRAVRRSR
jgi:DNA-directed RNA polymerase specialized sigma24 family protein